MKNLTIKREAKKQKKRMRRESRDDYWAAQAELKYRYDCAHYEWVAAREFNKIWPLSEVRRDEVANT